MKNVEIVVVLSGVFLIQLGVGSRFDSLVLRQALRSRLMAVDR